MKVGFTYDLRSWYLDRGYSMEDTAEFDKIDTVNSLEAVISKMGFETEKIGNAFQLRIPVRVVGVKIVMKSDAGVETADDRTFAVFALGVKRAVESFRNDAPLHGQH